MAATDHLNDAQFDTAAKNWPDKRPEPRKPDPDYPIPDPGPVNHAWWL